MLPRGRAYRYPPGRNMPDLTIGGAPGGMLPVPYNIGGVPFRDASFSQPMSTGALATALANATPEQQRTVSLVVHCICKILWKGFYFYGFRVSAVFQFNYVLIITLDLSVCV